MGLIMKHDTDFGVLTGNNIDTRFFKAGTTIFREGDEAHELYVIKSGEVRVQIGNRTVSELSADHVFGEMALIDNEPRSASAIAVTDVELVPVSEKQFLFLVSQNSLLRSQGHAGPGPAAASDQQDARMSDAGPDSSGDQPLRSLADMDGGARNAHKRGP